MKFGFPGAGQGSGDACVEVQLKISLKIAGIRKKWGGGWV